jgi:molybdenum cofactor cytidylyltransferase
MITIIVLAAGKSSRTIENKLLAAAPGGGTLIEQTVDHAVAAGPVIVVTGHQAEQVRNALSQKPVRFVHAAEFAEGIAASLRAGIAALGPEIKGVLICLGDMPLVEPSTMRRILAAFDPAQGHEIIIPTYENQRGNPVFWGRRFFAELAQLTGDSGGRVILHRHKQYVAEIAFSGDEVLVDFDTPEQLAEFESKARPRNPHGPD